MPCGLCLSPSHVPWLPPARASQLGDFGISKVLEKTDQFATTVTGTP